MAKSKGKRGKIAKGDEGDWGADGLTAKERRFVKALVGPAAGNATKAAEMAGYSAKNRNALGVMAHKALWRPNVQQALAHAYAKLFDSPEWTRNSLVDLASASPANFMVRDEQGNVRTDLNAAAARGAMGQLKEFDEEVTVDEKGKTTVTHRNLKLHDRTKALAILAKIHNLFTERVDLTSNGQQIKAYVGLPLDDDDNAP